MLRLVLLSALVLAAAPVTAAGFQSEIKPLGGERVEVRVFNPRTGATFWRRKLLRLYRLQWFSDHQALAIIEDAVGHQAGYYRLHVWRPAKRTFRLDDLPGWEVVQDVAWSGDHQRILFRGAASFGEADQGFGRLWCLDLETGRIRLVAGGSITRMVWVTPRRFRYWTGKWVPPPGGGEPLVLSETALERACDSTPLRKRGRR